MKRILLLAFAAFAFTNLMVPVSAAEFRPYPNADITPAQWQEYHAKIVQEFGSTAQQYPAQFLVTYMDKQKQMNFAFTTEGHAAHPAWITRLLGQRDGAISIEQIGYFAGDEEPFKALYEQYLELNEQIKQRAAQPASNP